MSYEGYNILYNLVFAGYREHVLFTTIFLFVARERDIASLHRHGRNGLGNSYCNCRLPLLQNVRQLQGDIWT